MVGLRGDTEDGRALQSQQLHDDRADSAGGRGDCNRLALSRCHGPDGRVGGAADHVQRARHFPAQIRGLLDQLRDGDRDVLSMTGAPPRPTEDLVIDGELGHPRANRTDDPGQVAAFARRERGRKRLLECPDSDGRFARIDGGRGARGRRLRRPKGRAPLPPRCTGRSGPRSGRTSLPGTSSSLLARPPSSTWRTSTSTSGNRRHPAGATRRGKLPTAFNVTIGSSGRPPRRSA